MSAFYFVRSGKEKSMKRILTGLFLSLLIILSFNQTPIKADDGYTVTVVNGNPDGGNVTIATKEGDDYIDSGSTSITVASGTKVKIWFADGLNEGYEVYCWATVSDGTMTLVSDGDEGNHTDEKFIKTITEDFTIYVFTKSDNDHVVSFYNSALESKRSLIGLAIVADGEEADTDYVTTPVQSGYDFDEWSESIENVTEDMEVYPTYTSNIWTVTRDYYPLILKGLLNTILLSVVAVCLALIGGLVLCLIRLSNFKIGRLVATAYVEIIRGIPLLLQLLIVYAILGPTRIQIGSYISTEVISCVLTLFINSSAYVCEIFRSGIQAVDPGQTEAGRALGLSQWQVYSSIVLPQGFRNALPSIVNELIAMIKETSLAVNIDASIGELMGVRSNITASTFIVLPAYFVVAILYFCLTFSLSKAAGHIEKRLSTNEDD